MSTTTAALRVIPIVVVATGAAGRACSGANTARRQGAAAHAAADKKGTKRVPRTSSLLVFIFCCGCFWPSVRRVTPFMGPVVDANPKSLPPPQPPPRSRKIKQEPHTALISNTGERTLRPGGMAWSAVFWREEESDKTCKTQTCWQKSQPREILADETRMRTCC